VTTFAIGVQWMPYEAPAGFALYLPVTVMSLYDLPMIGVRLSDLDPHPDHAIISIAGAAIKWMSNGGTPSAEGAGLRVPANVFLPHENCYHWLKQLKFIEAGEGSAQLMIEYFYSRV
jgi:hypothetical protein